MKKFSDLKWAMEKVQKEVDWFLKYLGENCENIEIDYNNPDEKLWLQEALTAEDKLYGLNYDLKHLQGDVIKNGVLIHNSDKRYTLEGTDHYFTSGSPIEWFDEEDNVWRLSTMEHNGEDYYIVGYGREKSPHGIKVRVRERIW